MNLTTRRRDEVRVYSLSDCEELLRNAMSGDRTPAPFGSIGLFCGLAAGERTSEPALVGRSPHREQILIRSETTESYPWIKRPGWFIPGFPSWPGDQLSLREVRPAELYPRNLADVIVGCSNHKATRFYGRTGIKSATNTATSSAVCCCTT